MLVAVETSVPPAAWAKLVTAMPDASVTVEDDVEDACAAWLDFSSKHFQLKELCGPCMLRLCPPGICSTDTQEQRT